MVIKNIFRNKVIKNFSFLTISNFLNQFILAVAFIKIARTLGPSNFGLYTYILVQSLLFAAIGELGLKNLVITTIARFPDKAKSVLVSSIFLQLLGLILSSIILIIYQHYKSSLSFSLITYLLFNVLLINLWSTGEATLQGQQRMAVSTIINTGFSLVWLLFVLFINAHLFTVEFLIRYYVIIQVCQISTLYAFLMFKKDLLPGSLSFAFPEAFKLFQQSSYYYFNILVSLPASSLSNNFLEINSTKSEIGYFNTSNRLMNPINIIINMALLAVFPNISALWLKDKDSFVNKLKSGVPFIIVGFGLICFSFVMVSKEVIVILFGEKFLPSFYIIRFQTWFIYLYSLNCFMGTIWASSDKQKWLLMWGIINSLVATPLLWIGSKYGGLGISYGYLLAFSLTFPFLFYHFKKSLEIEMKLFKEFIIVIILFIVSVFIPASTSLLLRLVIVLITIATISKMYYRNTIGRFKYLPSPALK